jgi:hypothetical protein
MYLERHYQNAYVTPDINKAIEAMKAQYGLTDADVLYTEATTPVWTPNGSGQNTSKLAFIWIGKLQYELIEPVSGPSDLYSAAVDPDQLLRFHHVAMRVMDWDSFRAAVDKQKHPVAIEGEGGGGLKFLYLDARETLGHYLEYVYAPPEFWARMDPNGATEV